MKSPQRHFKDHSLSIPIFPSHAPSQESHSHLDHYTCSTLAGQVNLGTYSFCRQYRHEKNFELTSHDVMYCPLHSACQKLVKLSCFSCCWQRGGWGDGIPHHLSFLSTHCIILMGWFGNFSHQWSHQNASFGLQFSKFPGWGHVPDPPPSPLCLALAVAFSAGPSKLPILALKVLEKALNIASCDRGVGALQKVVYGTNFGVQIMQCLDTSGVYQSSLTYSPQGPHPAWLDT